MHILKLTAAFALALAVLSVPASAATPTAPKNGEVVTCNVVNLMPETFFLQCADVFAGTLVEKTAGGYSGMLVCQFFGQADCQQVVPANVDKSVGSLKGHNALVCTMSDARDIVAQFTCVL